MSTLSDKLKQLRGPTPQAEMARQLGIPRTQWIRYENGQNSPSAEMLERICRTNGVSADWLLGLEGASDDPVAIVRRQQNNLDAIRLTAAQLTEQSAALAGTIKKLKKML